MLVTTNYNGVHGYARITGAQKIYITNLYSQLFNYIASYTACNSTVYCNDATA